MDEGKPGVLVADAASQAADPAFAAAAHGILSALVADGAALGWLDPPPLAEVAALLRSVGEACAAGDGALRAAYLLPGASAAGLTAPSATVSPAGGEGPPGARAAPPTQGGTAGGPPPSPPPPDRLVGIGYWTRYERPTHRPHADMRRIAVARHAQGRGAGRALTSALIDAARAARIEMLTLDARGDNTGALRLYRSLGFSEYGRLRDFVAVGERRYDTVLCCLDLRGQHPGGAVAGGPA